MPKYYPNNIKNQAISLRRRGLTYTEIIELLRYPIPKNTFTGWFKNIILSNKAKKRIMDKIWQSGSKGRAIAWKNTKERREKLLKDTKNRVKSEFQQLDKVSIKLCLAMLYLGEGGKTGERVRLGNSDPRVVRIFLDFLRKSFNIDEYKIRGKVQCRADQDVKELEKYWSRVSNIPLSQFHKSYIDKRTIGKPTEKKGYKGVFVVEYYSNKIFLELMYISDIIYEQVKKGL